MNDRLVAKTVKHVLLTASISYLACQILRDTPIDIRYLNSDSVRGIVRNGETCPVKLAEYGQGLIVKNDSLSFSILPAKLTTFFNPKYLKYFFFDQFQFSHFYDEVLIAQCSMVTIAFSFGCLGTIFLLVIRRMGLLVPRQKFEELRSLEAVELENVGVSIRTFCAEKFCILLFCIARGDVFVEEQRHYTDFGEYVRDTLSLHTKATDLTFFAAFFSILGLVQIGTSSIFRRFLKTIPLLNRQKLTKLRSDLMYISLFGTACFLTIISGVLFGCSLLAFNFFHPIYAIILILESYRAGLSCLFVLDRLSLSLSASRMLALENRQDLTEEKLAEIISKGGENELRTRGLRAFYENSTLLASLFLNLLYAVTGIVYNRKLLAVSFVLDLNIIVDYFLSSKEVSEFVASELQSRGVWHAATLHYFVGLVSMFHNFSIA